MDRNILKVDTDTYYLFSTINIISERLIYLNDSGVFPFRYIKKIIASKKKRWNVKIYLSKNITVELIILLQLILASDYKKEINTMINHYALKMEYSNRMFTIKKYKNNDVLISREIDITNKIIEKIKNEKRKRLSA